MSLKEIDVGFLTAAAVGCRWQVVEKASLIGELILGKRGRLPCLQGAMLAWQSAIPVSQLAR